MEIFWESESMPSKDSLGKILLDILCKYRNFGKVAAFSEVGIFFKSIFLENYYFRMCCFHQSRTFLLKCGYLGEIFWKTESKNTSKAPKAGCKHVYFCCKNGNFNPRVSGHRLVERVAVRGTAVFVSLASFFSLGG